MVDRLRDSDVSIYDHAPTAMEEDPYADSGIYEAIVHKIKVCYLSLMYVCLSVSVCLCLCVCDILCLCVSVSVCLCALCMCICSAIYVHFCTIVIQFFSFLAYAKAQCGRRREEEVYFTRIIRDRSQLRQCLKSNWNGKQLYSTPSTLVAIQYIANPQVICWTLVLPVYNHISVIRQLASYVIKFY